MASLTEERGREVALHVPALSDQAAQQDIREGLDELGADLDAAGGRQRGHALGAMHGAGSLTREGSYLGVLLIALLMVQVGGRVIPLFTSLRLGRSRPEDRPGLEPLSLGSMYAVVLLQLAVLVGVDPAQGLLAGAMLIAGSANAVRLARWDGVYTARAAALEPAPELRLHGARPHGA